MSRVICRAIFSLWIISSLGEQASAAGLVRGARTVVVGGLAAVGAWDILQGYRAYELGIDLTKQGYPQVRNPLEYGFQLRKHRVEAIGPFSRAVDMLASGEMDASAFVLEMREKGYSDEEIKALFKGYSVYLLAENLETREEMAKLKQAVERVCNELEEEEGRGYRSDDGTEV